MENVKVKIKFPYSLFSSDVDRSFDIILDGGVEFRERFSMRLRIPAASTFASEFMRCVEGRQYDVFRHGDSRRLSAKQKRNLRREIESLVHDSQLENGQIAREMSECAR